jgi:hypothetical protein
MSENTERIMLPLDLRMKIQEDCAKTSQRPATRILWILTEFYRDRLPPEVYQELHNRYEMTAYEQRELKNQKVEQVKRTKQKGNVKLKNQLIGIEHGLAVCDLRLKNPVSEQNARFWEGRKRNLLEEKGIVEAQLKAESE